VFHVFGFALGVCCGAIELYLLRVFISHTLSRNSVPFWIPPLKFLILLAFGLGLGKFSPEQLPSFGIGAAAVLVCGAAIGFVKARSKKQN